jgi:DNA-binding CsgD family transcriptional regulator/tetratricopeptide (TPR) repeat protein
MGVLLVISYRADEVGPKHPLQSVIGDLPAACLHRLQLAPLSAAAVGALAMAAGRLAPCLHDVTGGNPFFVTEALAAPENQVPATVRDAVIARMARLSEPARAIVDLAAVIPGKTEKWLLEKLTDSSGALLQECLAVGMVVLADGAIAFRHELARRAVEENLPLPRRQDLHAAVLATLLAAPGGETAPTRLVHHADQAGDSTAVLLFAPLAAERAATLGAHREAAAHYASALRHGDSLPPAGRAALLDRLSYEDYLTDSVEEAIEAREASLQLWRNLGDRLKEGDNLRWLSRLSWFNGQRAAAERHAIDAIEILESLPPGRELAMAYSNRSQLHMLADEAEQALDWGGKAIALATELGDSETLIHALNNVGTARAFKLDLAGSDLERSLMLALGGGFQEHAARAYTNLSSTAIRLRNFASASRHLSEGIAYCEAHDLGSWIRYMIAFRAQAFLAQGDWSAAAADAEAVMRHPCVAPISQIPAMTVLALVRLRRGEPEVARLLDEAWDLAQATGEMQRIGPVMAARAEAAWLAGEQQTVLPDLRASHALACQQGDPWILGELTSWLARADPAVAKTRPARIPEPYAHQLAGDWHAAAASWAKIGCPYEQAMALAEADDEPSLRLALSLCDQLEANPLAAILRRKLRASGIRGVARGVQERNRQNPLNLTGRELTVLGLLVEGCRNADIARRLFISEKTVDHHVSAILGKLDVRSRGEAAAAALRLGIVTPADLQLVAKK